MAAESPVPAASTPVPAADPAAPPRELTGDEAAVYDRQIRLWGLAAQRRLGTAKVLITGACNSALAQEIAKNVVLAGVGGVTLHVSGEAGVGAFLGYSVADAAAALADINPLVKIETLDGGEVGVGGFSLVCAVGCGEGYEARVGEKCRGGGVGFICGRVVGPVGFFFMDFGEGYRYTVQEKKRKRKKGEEEGEMDDVEKTLEYKSFADAMAGDWASGVRKSDCGWHAVACLREFEKAHGRLPGAEDGDVTVIDAIYVKMRKDKAANRSNEELVSDLGKTACYTVPAVAAIVGGMWGREAIKYVSRREEPLNNFMFYSSRTSSGSIVSV